MTEGLTPEIAPNNAPPISDSDFNKYFESGGEEGIAVEEPQPEVSTEEVKAEAPSQEEKPQVSTEEEKALERNYKAAMHAEREKRKELQAKVQNLQETFQKILIKTEQQNEPQPPSYDENPLDALKYEQEKIAEAVRHQQRMEAERQQLADLARRVQMAQLEFSKQQPDYMNAYHHLRQSRIEEYKAMGYNDTQAEQILINDELNFVNHAFSQGQNPAELAYRLAQLRGYQSNPPPSSVLKPKDKIETLERGIQASKSLTNAGGKTAPELTLEAVAAMSDEEFEKVPWEKLVRKYS